MEELEDCVRCVKRKHSFWEDPVALADNAKAFDLHISFNRAILLKRKSELIMNALKKICMKMVLLFLLDSVSLPP